MPTEIATLLRRRVFEAFGWGVIHSIWQGVLIAAVVGVALWLLQRAAARTRYAVAYAGLLAMPAVWALSIWRAAVTTPDYTGVLASLPFAPLLARATAVVPWIAVAWTLGVVMASVRLIGGWSHLREIRSAGSEAVGPWQNTVVVLAKRLGVRRAVTLLETAAADLPGVVGWLAPVILFPAGALTGMTPGQMEAILVHELAHIRRGDYLMNVVQAIVETIFFYHPGIWWLSRRVRIEREHCCDDVVVDVCGDPLSYASALVKIERRRSDGGELAVAASGGDLLGRVRRLVDVRPPVRAQVPAWLAGSVLFVPLMMAAGWVAAPSAAVPPSLPGTLWIGGLLGVMLGMRHALEPDHLAAISTLVTDEPNPSRAARLGLSWGLGHTTSLVAAGIILTVIRAEMPSGLADAFEIAVAVMLIGLGVRALRMAWMLGSIGSDAVHSHGPFVHRHSGVADHIHVGGFAIARRPLMVGMMHGLAGSGALAALVMARLPSMPEQMGYIVLFVVGSTLGMALLSGCAGWPLARLARRPGALAWVSGATGLLSMVVGVAWGGLLVWTWL